MAATLLALSALAVLLTPLGFKLVRMALVLDRFFAYDRQHVVTKIVVAVAGSVGTHYVFEHFLRVPLPSASVPSLRSLGF